MITEWHTRENKFFSGIFPLEKHCVKQYTNGFQFHVLYIEILTAPQTSLHITAQLHEQFGEGHGARLVLSAHRSKQCSPVVRASPVVYTVGFFYVLRKAVLLP